MTEINGMTYMTEAERKILPEIEECPAKFLQVQNPSEEFMRAAVIKNPYVIHFIDNQSYMVRMLAVKLDHRRLEDIRGITPEIRMAVAQKNTRGIAGANFNSRELEEYANAYNVMKFGPVLRKR